MSDEHETPIDSHEAARLLEEHRTAPSNDDNQLRAKIKAYADQLARGETESGRAAVAAALRLILVGVYDPR